MNSLLRLLRQQHSQMQSLLREANENSGRVDCDFSVILDNLDSFKKILVSHIHIENKKLYQFVLANEKTTRFRAMNIRIFLAELEKTQSQIIIFLNHYTSAEKIGRNFSRFKEDLALISEQVDSRIKLEEEIIFDLL